MRTTSPTAPRPNPLRSALIGGHIGGSLSPALHTAEAHAQGIEGFSYDLLDVEAPGLAGLDLTQVVQRAVAQGYAAFNVTHPCKQTVLAALDAIDADVEALGAANVVLVEDGRLVGRNTDHTGFLAALRDGLGDGPLGPVALIGAGGAGAAAGHALAAAGATEIVVVDVDPLKAADVVRRLVAGHPGLAVSAASPASLPSVLDRVDGILNATPVGMDGIPGSPVDVALLRSRHWVGDLVYRPVRTPLLDAAGRLGCRTVDGAAMLLGQAVDSFHLLTGRPADADRMARSLSALLAQRTEQGTGAR